MNKKFNDRHSSSKPAISSSVDLVDLTAHNCCGYCYILQLVDPVLHIGHANMLKSFSDEDLSTALDKLRGLACFPPSTVYCDEKFSFLPNVTAFYPHIVFTKKTH